jgi:hypothetical protein
MAIKFTAKDQEKSATTAAKAPDKRSVDRQTVSSDEPDAAPGATDLFESAPKTPGRKRKSK